jgi:hypothetical protein
LPIAQSAFASLTVRAAFVCIAIVKFIFACATLLAGTACNTLENRRDLYTTDPYFYYERPATTTVRKTTTTTRTTTRPVEFRPRVNSEETPELPGD